MQDKNGRELIEVKLKKVNKSAFVVPYFNGMETQNIEKAKLIGAEINDAGRIKFGIEFIINYRNAQLENGIKSIKNEDGTVKEDPTLEEILSLPDSDLGIIQEQLAKSWEDPEEDGKKASGNLPKK